MRGGAVFTEHLLRAGILLSPGGVAGMRDPTSDPMNLRTCQLITPLIVELPLRWVLCKEGVDAARASHRGCPAVQETPQERPSK